MQTGANWAGSFVVYNKTLGVWDMLGLVLPGMEKTHALALPMGSQRTREGPGG